MLERVGPVALANKLVLFQLLRLGNLRRDLFKGLLRMNVGLKRRTRLVFLIRELGNQMQPTRGRRGSPLSITNRIRISRKIATLAKKSNLRAGKETSTNYGAGAAVPIRTWGYQSRLVEDFSIRKSYCGTFPIVRTPRSRGSARKYDRVQRIVSPPTLTYDPWAVVFTVVFW